VGIIEVEPVVLNALAEKSPKAFGVDMFAPAAIISAIVFGEADPPFSKTRRFQFCYQRLRR
jgi:hypothetical protein